MNTWSSNLCLYFLDHTLLWETYLPLDWILHLLKVFLFVLLFLVRCLKFFTHIGKGSGFSHTLGKGLSNILKKATLSMSWEFESPEVIGPLLFQGVQIPHISVGGGVAGSGMSATSRLVTIPSVFL